MTKKTSWNLSHLTFQGLNPVLQLLVAVLQLLYPGRPTINALVRLYGVRRIHGNNVVLFSDVFFEVLQDANTLGHLVVETLDKFVDLGL